jgi:hypothetical protein
MEFHEYPREVERETFKAIMEKECFLEEAKIPKAFFTPHHGR